MTRGGCHSDTQNLPLNLSERISLPGKEITGEGSKNYQGEAAGFGLRPYQSAAIANLRSALAGGIKRVILVSPTGSGKTVIAKGIIDGAVAKGRRVMFLAPRRELIKQTSRTLARAGIDHGTIMAGDELISADVQVASWDSLRSWIRRGKIRAPQMDLLIVDEAHLSLAPTYQALLRDYYPETPIIGMTATPARSDGKPLGGLYQGLIEAADVRSLIDAGYLVEPRYYAPTKPDLEGLRVARGDYETKGIEARFNTPQIVGDVVYNWFRIARRRQTVVFAATVAHALHLRDRFRESGVTADYVHCQMDNREREAVLARVESGETQVICNVDILTFGWDQPSISCAVLARPTKSIVRYFQTVGRVLRPAPGKRDAIVIDHGGVVDELGFVDEPVEWTLDGDERIQSRRQRNPREKRPITCGDCATVYKGQRECPQCGAEPPARARDLHVYDGDLQELDREKRRANRQWSNAEKARFFGELKGYAASKGYSDGWAAHKYREKFGVWPNAHRHAPAVPPGPEALNWIRSRQIAWAKRRVAG